MAAAFNTRAASYCRNEWHRTCAERLVALCEIPAGCRVLDACTGTGFAALAVARVVGREGRVVGVDVSAGMLVEAERATLTRIIHEGADFGRDTKASAWYKAVATRAFSHDGGF